MGLGVGLGGALALLLRVAQQRRVALAAPPLWWGACLVVCWRQCWWEWQCMPGE